MARTIARWSWTLLLATLLAGCGTTHPLPPYEAPLARANVQSVRTTAYTHTESDHVAYGNHNALGGTLHAASINPTRSLDENAERGSAVRPAVVPVALEGGFHPPGTTAVSRTSGSDDAGSDRTTQSIDNDSAAIPTRGVGSAAADWSRWPAGTVFRIAATGQVYEVDDYGWALAGRNTIDLYQPTRAAMNAWGVRRVDIQILRWGDPAESLRMLRRHQEYRHIHRMALELEGRAREAAALE